MAAPDVPAFGDKSQQATARAGQQVSSSEFYFSTEYQELFNNPDRFHQVPFLTQETASSLPPGSLVRMQAMIQDMADPQYCQAPMHLPHSTCTGHDVPGNTTDANMHTTRIFERRPFFCVPVPGRSAWSLTAACSGNTTQGQTLDARDRTVAVIKQPCDCLLFVYDNGHDASLRLHDTVDVLGMLTAPCPASTCWRVESEMDAMEEEENGTISRFDDAASEAQRHRDTSSDLTRHCGDDVQPEADQTDKTTTTAGVPVAKAASQQEVVCVNALAFRRISPRSSSRELVSVSHPTVVVSNSSHRSKTASVARGKILQLLSTCLGHDTLAAEYLLLSCLAHVVSRPQDGSQSVIGPLSLNLVQSTPLNQAPAPEDGNVASALKECLSALLPTVAYLPLTTETCNEGWRPVRDPNTSRVSRSPLQLPQGCLLLVDELRLKEGQLNAAGIRSLQSLHGLIQEQILRYDFEYCENHPFFVDIPVVVLSAGKSLVADAVTVSLQLVPSEAPSTLSLTQIKALLDDLCADTLTELRAYLADAYQAPYAIGEAMVNRLQAEFVRLRKGTDSNGLSPQEFQHLLTVARLLAVSEGEDTLTVERWEAAQALERRRAERCGAVNHHKMTSR